MFRKKHSLIKGTLILTSAGLASRVLGFFFRIFLSHTFGEEQVGLYQLIFPFYALCLSLSTSGLETAISRSVSRFRSLGRTQDGKLIFQTGLILSVLISLLCTFLVQKNSVFLANRFLGDPRCATLLYLIVLALPAASVHSCICGYYYGLQNTSVPAISQLIEQSLRISSVFILYFIFVRKGIRPEIQLAVSGIIFGELAAAGYSLFSLKKRNFDTGSPYILSISKSCSELLRLSVPLTVNRTAITFLQGIEAASIPVCLELASHNASEALSIYGVLTGMALPCILFPCALTNSISLLLIPAVAQKQAENSSKETLLLIKKAAGGCFSLGLLCSVFFLLTGSFLGNFLFHSTLAGNFIATLAWICPFLYTSSALLSAINGLGLTTLTLMINLLGLSIRILSVYFGIPYYGITGYLWGLFISQLAVCLVASLTLSREIKKEYLQSVESATD